MAAIRGDLSLFVVKSNVELIHAIHCCLSSVSGNSKFPFFTNVLIFISLGYCIKMPNNDTAPSKIENKPTGYTVHGLFLKVVPLTTSFTIFSELTPAMRAPALKSTIAELASTLNVILSAGSKIICFASSFPLLLPKPDGQILRYSFSDSSFQPAPLRHPTQTASTTPQRAANGKSRPISNALADPGGYLAPSPLHPA